MKHESFTGARHKIARAFEFLDQFERECSTWEASIDVPVARSRDQGWHVWSAGPIPNPPVDLALLAGDVAHQLRSALDLGANAAVVANQGRPTAQTAFPVLMTEQAWKSNGLQRLSGALAIPLRDNRLGPRVAVRRTLLTGDTPILG